jgi:two-component system sensor histidine kinase MprB
MSLKWRIAAGMAVIAAFVAAFGATAAYLTTAARLHDNLDQSLVDAAVRIRTTPNRPDPDRDNNFGGQQGCPPAGFLQPATVAQIVETDGTLALNCLPGSRTVPAAAGRRDHDDHGEPEVFTVRTGRGDYRMISVDRGDGTVLQIGRSLASVDDVLRTLQVRLVIITGTGVLAAALLGWFLASRLVRPINRLQRATEHIARTGDLATDIPEGGSGEVGHLAASFTTMVGALSDSRARQQRLVADASHELRTPLTSLQTNAELLGRGDRLTADQRQQVSDGIRFEVGELTDLVTELVALARDPDADGEEFTDVDLAELATVAVDAARLRTDRPVELTTSGRTTLSGRALALSRAISNLLDNAIKYGAGPIEVTVHDHTVAVRDHGAGIPAADLPQVFDRFYRSDSARTEPGSGLGLAIVAQVAERHGGSTLARNTDDGGAVVGFTLP